MVFHKLFVTHVTGTVRKVRLKFDTKKSIESLRESVLFPVDWNITSVAYLKASRRR